MCEECMEKFPTAVALIEPFLELWPDAEFGPARLVLNDYNLQDGQIKWCIRAALAVLLGSPEGLDDVDEACITHYDSFDRRELVATIVVLLELLALPLEERGEA